jgi:hypothetical protein
MWYSTLFDIALRFNGAIRNGLAKSSSRDPINTPTHHENYQ